MVNITISPGNCKALKVKGGTVELVDVKLKLFTLNPTYITSVILHPKVGDIIVELVAEVGEEGEDAAGIPFITDPSCNFKSN